jgi:hypothetical protein
MVSSKTSAAFVIEHLKAERCTFNENAYELLKRQEKAFKLCCDLLKSDLMSQTQISSKQRYMKLRAQTFLFDVFNSLGAEMFLLFTLAVSITDLSKTLGGLFPALQEWWNGVGHPHGLTETALQLCDMNSVKKLATSTKKRPSQGHIGLSILFALVVRGLLQASLEASSSKRIRPEVDQECSQNTNKAAGEYGYLSIISLRWLIFVRAGNIGRTYRPRVRCSFAGFRTTDARFGYT